MADEQGNLDNLDTHNTHVKTGPMTEKQRLSKQKRFLKVYRKTANITASCEAAAIARQTFYNWRDHDEAFKVQLPDVDVEADETLEYAAYDRAVNGVESFVVSQGHVVYEEKPAFNEDGTPKLDKRGSQLYERGKPLKERKFSDTLLICLLKARMPKKYKEKREISGPNDGPIPVDFVTEWGGGILDDEEETSVSEG